jgi:cytochrome P450
MINDDEPRHRKLRNLAARAFTPRTIDETWEPRIRQITGELLDAVEAKGTFEVVADLASPLPVRMIAEIIGIEVERYLQFKQWSDEIAGLIGRYDLERVSDPAEIEAPADMGPLFFYFVQAIADRRANPRDDLITRLVEAEVDGERLTDFESVAFLVLLLVAGNETTTTAITNAMRVLVQHPEVADRLRADEAKIEPFIEEVLRWDAPIHSFYRRAIHDVQLGGQQIKGGDALLVLYAAANHDPAEFACPAGFDLDRGRRDHASFGIGVHYCLGANLARLEARTAIREIVRRLDGFTVEPSFEQRFREMPFFGGLTSLPLRFRRRTADELGTVE